MGYRDVRYASTVALKALLVIVFGGCAMTGDREARPSAPASGADLVQVSTSGRTQVPPPVPQAAAPSTPAPAPSAAQYAEWFADELLSDRDLADWRKEHALRYPDMGAVGVLVLSMRNQTSDPRMDRWIKQLVIELAARLRPQGLLIVGIDDTDPEPGSAPKASLGLSFSVRALPGVGGSPPAREVGDRPGTEGFPVEINAELVDGVSRRTVAGFRVRPPS